jgi:RimJ/RimL family protein N-acetyltransferase
VTGIEERLSQGLQRDALRLRQAIAADGPLLADWFSEPEIRRSWDLGAAEVEDPGAGLIIGLNDERGALVAEERGDPIGYLAYDRMLTGAVALHIAFAEAGRGRGIGSKALALLSDALLEVDGVTRVCALPAPENEAAKRALRRAGFVSVPRSWGRFDKVVEV